MAKNDFCMGSNRKAMGCKGIDHLRSGMWKRGLGAPFGPIWFFLLIPTGYFRQFWQVFRKSRETPVVLAIHSSWYSGAK